MGRDFRWLLITILLGLTTVAGKAVAAETTANVDDIGDWAACPGEICSCPPDGDVNGDGMITPRDALITFQHYLGSVTLDDCRLGHADVNRDGVITPADALCIFRKYLGMFSCLDYPVCRSNRDCGLEKFCEFPAGGCDNPGRMGTCEQKPDGCLRIWDPVCGCDGKTYGNDCERQAAGVSLDHKGVCVSSLCHSNDDCAQGKFCEFPAGGCEELSREGTCRPVPIGCLKIWDPVCGCDGKTYDNDCYRQMAQVPLSHRGECKSICRANDDCAQGKFCEFPDGQCGVNSTVGGTCAQIPMGCPDVWDPVCGCDGKTYSNDCDRQAAGVSLDHKGTCELLCQTDGDCRTFNDYCSEPSPCSCRALHVDEPDPVCDGNIVYCFVEPCSLAGKVTCNNVTGKCEFEER